MFKGLVNPTVGFPNSVIELHIPKKIRNIKLNDSQLLKRYLNTDIKYQYKTNMTNKTFEPP